MPDPAAELRRADALHVERRYQDAVEAYRSALAGDASLHAAWYGLGCASLTLKAYGDAAEALGRAVALQPDGGGMRCNLAEALFQLGEVDAAIAAYQRAAESGDAEVRSVALSGIACIAPGAPHQDNFNVMAVAAALGGRGRRAASAASRRRGRAKPGRKLRIGYLGAFFGARNWMKMYMGVHQRA